jgi:hypothetical protein
MWWQGTDVSDESFSWLAETLGMRWELHDANDRPPTVRMLEDHRDDLHLAAAVRAAFQVDLEHALEQLGPAQTHWAGG